MPKKSMSKSLIDEFELSEPSIEEPEIEEPVNDVIEQLEMIQVELSVIVRFINSLDGSEEMKRFVNQYIKDNFKIKLEDSDLGYFDWLFHQHLRDAFIEYSKWLVRNNSGFFDTEVVVNKEPAEIVWFDVFEVIAAKNSKHNIGKFVMENN